MVNLKLNQLCNSIEDYFAFSINNVKKINVWQDLGWINRKFLFNLWELYYYLRKLHDYAAHILYSLSKGQAKLNFQNWM